MIKSVQSIQQSASDTPFMILMLAVLNFSLLGLTTESENLKVFITSITESPSLKKDVVSSAWP